jgi:hypothetical protein
MRALTVIVLLGFASTVAAQPAKPTDTVAMVDARPSLAWRAPAGCPDDASLRARIEQRLDRSLDDVVIGIEVDVALNAGRYTARIDLRAMTVANDVRTLTSVRCEELADAVAVIVTRVASEAIAKRRVAIREEQAAAIVVETVEVKKPRMWSIGSRVSAVSGIGVIPKVGTAAEVAIVVRRDNLLAEVAGTRWLHSYAQFHNGAPAVVNVLLDTAAGRFGWRPKDLPLRAWAAVEFGLMAGNSVDLPSQQLESGRWVAAGVGFGVAWQMNKWLRLVGTNESMVAIDRVRFTMGNGIVVYAPSPMSFRASAGIEVGWQ